MLVIVFKYYQILFMLMINLHNLVIIHIMLKIVYITIILYFHLLIYLQKQINVNWIIIIKLVQ